jgi:hypothetical protein
MCTDGEISGHVNIGLVASITEGVPAIEPSHHRVHRHADGTDTAEGTGTD